MKEEDLLKAIGQVDDAFLQSCEDEWDSLQNENQPEEDGNQPGEDGNQPGEDEDQSGENENIDRKIVEISKADIDHEKNRKRKNLSWRHFAGLAACACLVLLIFALVPGRLFHTSQDSDSANLYSSEETAQADEDIQNVASQDAEEEQAESASRIVGNDQSDQEEKEAETQKEYKWTETGICLADITVNSEKFHLMTGEEAETYGIEEEQLSNVTESMCGKEIGQVESCPDEPALIGATVYCYESQEDNTEVCILKAEDSYWFYVKD